MENLNFDGDGNYLSGILNFLTADCNNLNVDYNCDFSTDLNPQTQNQVANLTRSEITNSMSNLFGFSAIKYRSKFYSFF